jgi:hypothetical protein
MIMIPIPIKQSSPGCLVKTGDIFIVIFGLEVIIAVQAMLAFPIKDPMRKEVTHKAKVIIKDH